MRMPSYKDEMGIMTTKMGQIKVGNLTPKLKKMVFFPVKTHQFCTSETSGRIMVDLALEKAIEKLYHGLGAPNPKELPLVHMNPEALAVLSRENKCWLMGALSGHNTRSRITLSVSKLPYDTIKEPPEHSLSMTDKRGDEVSYATILILAVAIRGTTISDKLFPELLALSPTAVVTETTKYLNPPLVRLEHLPKLVHCTARRVAHKHHGQTKTPKYLCQSVAAAIAHVIELCSNLKDPNQYRLAGVIEQCLIDGDDSDKGCQIQLLIEGILLYVRGQKEKLAERKEVMNFCADLAGNAVGLAPAYGSVGALVAGVFKEIFRRKTRRRQEEWDNVVNRLDEVFQKSVFDPILYKGVVQVSAAGGTTKPIVIDYKDFQFWQSKIKDWCVTGSIG